MTPEKRSATNDPSNHPLSRLGIQLDQLLDLMPSYVTILDPHHRILYANQRVRQDFGNGTGKFCNEVFKKRQTRCRICPVKRTWQDKGIHFGEETFQKDGGKIIQVLINSTPLLDANDQVTAVMEMATDITALKKSHQELATLGQSIALLSHSIKNILEGLQGGAYVVNEAIKDDDLELARKGWRIVDRNISDISDAVQNILFSAKNRPLKYNKASPFRLAAQAVDLYAEKAATMGVKLTLAGAADLPDARLDASSVRRMLNNLIWNALEACYKNKSRKDHRVTVTADGFDETRFIFQIQDNGIGIKESDLYNIFEEFFSKKGSSGTGLGLAVVEKIVNKHGGQIEVSSKPGKGSTFKITLNY